jgi:hypothetical protein
MNNKQTIRRNIMTGHLLSDFYKDEDYPIDLLEITLELSRNDSNFDKIRKLELEVITENIIKIIQKHSKDSQIGFGTIGFEMDAGLLPGEHVLNFRIILVGKNLKKITHPIFKDMEDLVRNDVGGKTQVKTKTVDKQTLQIDLIPIQLDLSTFLELRQKNLKDKIYYSDDVLKVLFKTFFVLSKDELLSPLFRFNIDHND